MKKLNKAQLAKWEEFKAAISEERDALETEIDAYNALMAETWERVESALLNLNQKIVEAEEWRGEIASEMQDYFDERSERWQEGDAGCAYQDWINEWEAELSEVELDAPEDVEMPDDDAGCILENLTENPSGS
jgi:hypothetical protein